MIRPVLVVALALNLSFLLSSPASAGGPGERRGDCVGGPGHWRLVVQREGARNLRVRFEVKDVTSGQIWQLFLSDNGVGIYSATETVDDGTFQVRKVTRDRAGRDRISATAVNADSGATCAGVVRY